MFGFSFGKKTRTNRNKGLNKMSIDKARDIADKKKKKKAIAKGQYGAAKKARRSISKMF